MDQIESITYICICEEQFQIEMDLTELNLHFKMENFLSCRYGFTKEVLGKYQVSLQSTMRLLRQGIQSCSCRTNVQQSLAPTGPKLHYLVWMRLIRISAKLCSPPAGLNTPTLKRIYTFHSSVHSHVHRRFVCISK